MPHAMQIRQTGGSEVLNWIVVVALAADMQSVGYGRGALRGVSPIIVALLTQ
jgi:hypothetical protein